VELQSCTFAPQINRQINRRSSVQQRSRYLLPPPTLAVEWGEEDAEEEKVLRECTFAPKINAMEDPLRANQKARRQGVHRGEKAMIRRLHQGEFTCTKVNSLAPR
jgi:hypothetical protein